MAELLAEDVLSWAQQNNIKNSGQSDIILDSKSELNIKLAEKVAIWQGNIVNLKVDAIVNSTDGGYRGEYGVDGAIHSAAGRELRGECEALRPCKIGEAKITLGYGLSAKNIIHTVGPVDDDVVDLKSCYENSLELMLSHNLRTIVFPCISTGERGFPREQAANVAIITIRQFLEKNYNKISKIIFCTFLQEDYKIYERLMWKYFPTHRP